MTTSWMPSNTLAIAAPYWMKPKAMPEGRVDNIITAQGMLELDEITKDEGKAA